VQSFVDKHARGTEGVASLGQELSYDGTHTVIIATRRPGAGTT